MEYTLDEICAALSDMRIPAAVEEYDLHRAAMAALDAHSVEYAHEVRLGGGCRIDFLAGGVGIEVKKGKPARMQLLNQVRRYAQFDSINALLVIAPGKLTLPESVNGKRVKAMALGRLWGVALP